MDLYELKRKIEGKEQYIIGTIAIILLTILGSISLFKKENLEGAKYNYADKSNATTSNLKEEIEKRVNEIIENKKEEDKLALQNDSSVESNNENTTNNYYSSSEIETKIEENNEKLSSVSIKKISSDIKDSAENLYNTEEKQKEKITKSNEKSKTTNESPKVTTIKNETNTVNIANTNKTINKEESNQSTNKINVLSNSTTSKTNVSNNTTSKTSVSNNNTSSKTTTTKTKKKNGWLKEGNYTYYYKNGKKLKDTYVDYIYLDKKGRKQEKMGNFTATLYGARAWANQSLKIRSKANSSSSSVGTIPTGGKVTILSGESANYYLKVKYGKKTGYVNANNLMINLPDVMPDLYYKITNVSGSIYKSAGYSISGVTGKNLYGFKKQQNNKIGKKTYYAPLLYPVAKQLQKAYDIAKKEGYNFKIYDTYRPRSVSLTISSKLKKLYNKQSKVKKAIDYDKNGNYWGQSWFLAQTISNHNRGIALDMTLTNSQGTEYTMQSKMHTLDTTSLVKYNNGNANKLRSIMTKAGFETLSSEWWHFEEVSYKSSPYNSFKIK